MSEDFKEEVEAIRNMIAEAEDRAALLYAKVRAAKRGGASFRDLVKSTGLPLATVQNIIDGKNPRIVSRPLD